LCDFAKNAGYSAVYTSRYSARFSSLSNYRRN
jgi:hypothetical protein